MSSKNDFNWQQVSGDDPTLPSIPAQQVYLRQEQVFPMGDVRTNGHMNRMDEQPPVLPLGNTALRYSHGAPDWRVQSQVQNHGRTDRQEHSGVLRAAGAILVFLALGGLIAVGNGEANQRGNNSTTDGRAKTTDVRGQVLPTPTATMKPTPQPTHEPTPTVKAVTPTPKSVPSTDHGTEAYVTTGANESSTPDGAANGTYIKPGTPVQAVCRVGDSVKLSDGNYFLDENLGSQPPDQGLYPFDASSLDVCN